MEGVRVCASVELVRSCAIAAPLVDNIMVLTLTDTSYDSSFSSLRCDM